jgi:hypothetical protein
MVPPFVEQYQSLTDAKVSNQLAVALGTLGMKVIKETTTSTDELHQASAGVMVFGIRPKVVIEVTQASCEQSNLGLRGARIFFMPAVFFKDFCSLGSRQRHCDHLQSTKEY